MTHGDKPRLPIGYWLKRADNVLTEEINRAPAAHGVSRFDWQVLNLLQERGRTSRERIWETMRSFVDLSDLDAILSNNSKRGWGESVRDSTGGQEEFQLTERGRRQYESIFATQKEVGERAMQGISEEEYATALRVLQRIVSNLGGSERPIGK